VFPAYVEPEAETKPQDKKPETKEKKKAKK
jgi:hypothetical protein